MLFAISHIKQCDLIGVLWYFYMMADSIYAPAYGPAITDYSRWELRYGSEAGCQYSFQELYC